ncbi:hypothetical protein HKD37_20G055654 [Glycine soja]
MTYESESLYFQDGGLIFQQLRELSLEKLPNLKSIIIDEGALHSLEILRIWALSELKTILRGIQHLKKLIVLAVHDMSTEFNK